MSQKIILNSLKIEFSIPNLHIFCLSISPLDLVLQILPIQKEKKEENKTSLTMGEDSWEGGGK